MPRSPRPHWNFPAIAKAGKMEEAIGHAVALAKYPNVSIKMSNLPNASLEPYPYKDLTPHLAKQRKQLAAERAEQKAKAEKKDK